MSNNQPDVEEHTTERYKAIVLEHLNSNSGVASKDELRRNLNIPDWYITQITGTETFYTSLNHNGAYVASKFLVGRRSDHEHVWRAEVEAGHAVFHREESTKATLQTLVFKRPSGLTPGEATDLLGRDCYQPLADLAADGDIDRVDLDHTDTIVYVHHWPSIREDQLAERRTDQPVELDEKPIPVDEFLLRENLLQVFLDAVEDSVTSASRKRVAACLLRQFDGDSFTALEMRLRRNHSLQDVLGYDSADDVDDATTLWRAFDDLTKAELKDCLQTLISEVSDTVDTAHVGEFPVVDGTHVDAWANTRDWIEDGVVEGAAWGKHDGWFYGYQVMLMVDPQMELPVAIVVRQGNTAEKTLLKPLIADFRERYDVDEFPCEVVYPVVGGRPGYGGSDGPPG